MKNTLPRFWFWLALLTTLGALLLIVVEHVLPQEMPLPFRQGLVGSISRNYLTITPLLALLIVKRFHIRGLAREYKLTLRGVDWPRARGYVLCTLVLLPVLITLFVNICYPGRVTYFYDGAWLMILRAVAWSVTVTSCGALLGEVVWRGFLEQEIVAPPQQKYMLIGLVWGVWRLPMIIISSVGHSPFFEILLYALLIVVTCVLCACYLATALHYTRTLFVTAILQGVITLPASSFTLSVSTADSYSLTYRGILFLCILILFLVTNFLFAKKTN